MLEFPLIESEGHQLPLLDIILANRIQKINSWNTSKGYNLKGAPKMVPVAHNNLLTEMLLNSFPQYSQMGTK